MSQNKQSGMRDSMPSVATFIDDLRDVFGKAEIDAVIRTGLKPGCQPEQRFFASEEGHLLGTLYAPDPSKAVSAVDMVIGPVLHAPKRGGR